MLICAFCGLNLVPLQPNLQFEDEKTRVNKRKKMSNQKNTAFQMIADIDGDLRDILNADTPDVVPVLAVRNMVLFTFNKRHAEFATRRLQHSGISYIIQPVGNDRLNLFFGKKQCLDAIRMIVNRPLNQLTPEEDFILGAMLGYDICAQCERFCERKERCNHDCRHCQCAQ